MMGSVLELAIARGLRARRSPMFDGAPSTVHGVITPKGCRGAACPAFAFCQGKGLARGASDQAAAHST